MSVVIASRGRHKHLAYTLSAISLQTYPGEIEVIVIDDASEESLEPVVRQCWPSAVFVRQEKNIGQCACRTQGFRLARGKYIVQLDDDAHPVQATAFQRAVSLLEARPEIGILNCYTFNGPDMPPGGLPSAASRFCVSFHGCSAVFRSTAVQAIGGYSDFLERHWEEEDLSIRMMKAGWAVYFASDVVVHHRLSAVNRNASWTWRHGVRNKLWGLVMHWPASRLPLEMTWTVALAAWDALRLKRWGALAVAVHQFAQGLPKVLALRQPMSRDVMQRYDALRFGPPLMTPGEYDDPPRMGIPQIVRWLFRHWRNRPRERSFWDKRPGDIGSTDTVKFAHEYRRDRA